MSSFSDDFNRANGPVGNGWTVNGFQCAILNGEVTAGSNGRITRILASGSSYHSAEFDSRHASGYTYHAQPCVKSDATQANSYRAYCQENSTGYLVQISRFINGAQVALVNSSVVMTKTNPARLRLVYDAGNLAFYINGILACTAVDNTHAALNYVGAQVAVNVLFADNWYGTTDLPVAFDEVNEPLVQMAVEQGVEFVGTGTAWTPGAPGDPVFTVDKGTLSGQEIQSATQATANYLPPQADDIATFTDPSTGLTDQVALSTGFQVQSGGSGSADEYFDVLEAGAINPAAFLEIMSFLSDLFGSPPSGGSDLVSWLYNGSEDYPGWTDFIQSWPRLYQWITNQSAWDDPTGDSLLTRLMDTLAAAQAAEVSSNYTNSNQTISLSTILGQWGDVNPTIYFLAQQLAAIRTVEDYSIQDVITKIDSLMGFGPGAFWEVLQDLESLTSQELGHYDSVKTYLDLLTSEGLYGLNDVATWINNARGLDGRDLTQVYDYLTTIRGDNATTLLSIYNAISGIQPTDLSDVLAHLDTIISDVADLSSQESGHYDTVHTQLIDLQTSVTNGLATVNGKLDTIITKEDAILAAIAAIRPADYPLWPGAGSATLGVPVSGAGDLAIPGPLDGLLIDVTTWPRDIEAWTNGGTRALKYAGHITFVSDIAYTEEIQFPATNKRVVVPKSMLTAASALVHLRAGVQATITPWSYTP